MSDNADTFVPWGLHPIKPWVVSELMNRAKEYGMNSTLVDTTKRPGIRSAWGRFFSNGIPSDPSGDKLVFDHDGFLMYGVNGFKDSYGFDTDQVIGLDAKGNKHTLPNAKVNVNLKSFPHRPPPCVQSIDVDLMGGQNASFSGLCRKAVVKWKCFSLDQLNYLTPYFLSPRVTCCVEWGWSNYNPASLVDYTNIDEMQSLFMDAQKVMKKISLSNGNYDMIMGYVIDFDYSMGDDGSYECSTTVASVSWLFDGIDFSNQTLKRKTAKGWEKVQDFSEFNRYCGWDSNAAQLADPNFPKPDGRMFASDDREAGKGQSMRKWVRFDYLVEVMNYYFACVIGNSPEYSVDSEDSDPKKFVWNKVNISDVLVSAHPGIKSTDADILIPNAFAPKYQPKNNDVVGTGHLGSTAITIENTQYFKKFGKIENVITAAGFSDTYDDLFDLIQSNVSGNQKKSSFPVFVFPSSDDINKAYSKSVGYVGYLRDIYISTNFIRDEAGKARTAKVFLESIVSKISGAMSGVVELKVVPRTDKPNETTVIDSKLSPLYTTEMLSKINLFDINNAYLLRSGMNVRMSQEMANQVLFATGRSNLDSSKTVSQTETTYDKFVSSDRLCPYAHVPAKMISNNDPSSEKNVIKRTSDITPYCVSTRSGIKYYLIEPDGELMKKVVTDDPSPQAVYLNSAIMPGATFNMDMLGLGGWTYLGQFVLEHVPTQYSYRRAVWQISKIKQTIEGGNWLTSVEAQVRPMSTLQ